MAVDIRLKHSTTQGAKPSTLLDGELGVGIPGGVVYYRDETGTVQALTQRLRIGSSASLATDPQVGMLYFNNVSNNLQVCTSISPSVEWATVGIPEDSDLIVIKAPFAVVGSPNDTTYIATKEPGQSGYDNVMDGEYVYINRLRVLRETRVGGSLIAEGDFLSEGPAAFQQALTLTGLLTTTYPIVRYNSGAHVYHHDPAYASGGRIRVTNISNFPPADNVGINGDIYFGY